MPFPCFHCYSGSRRREKTGLDPLCNPTLPRTKPAGRGFCWGTALTLLSLLHVSSARNAERGMCKFPCSDSDAVIPDTSLRISPVSCNLRFNLCSAGS